MIESIITSKTRIKLLLKFFLNSQTTSYLRGLEAELGESSNSMRASCMASASRTIDKPSPEPDDTVVLSR